MTAYTMPPTCRLITASLLKEIRFHYLILKTVHNAAAEKIETGVKHRRNNQLNVTKTIVESVKFNV